MNMFFRCLLLSTLLRSIHIYYFILISNKTKEKKNIKIEEDY